MTADLSWSELAFIFVASIFGLCSVALALNILVEVVPQAWRRMRG